MLKIVPVLALPLPLWIIAQATADAIPVGPFVNAIIQAGGMTSMALANFYLVLRILKMYSHEMHIERQAHYNEIVRIMAVQETWHWVSLERLGVEKAKLEELQRLCDARIKNGQSRFPKRESDVKE